jgi:hypothetical protein
VPFIEECLLDTSETYRFNLSDFIFNVDSIALNIKPSLFQLLALLMKELYIGNKATYTLINGLINSI